ncbi:MAG TPA: magnesium/cobalt transporter CorA [Thermotogota bacterium]|nr:magnesium/cobalt transporter CorA [Thermotogota bacterium]HRW92321.1 magnesium/cobalt transporter CorA [Thermotogota bacterium]
MGKFFFLDRKEKRGAAPGTLIHVGEWKEFPVQLTVRRYDEGVFQEDSFSREEFLAGGRDSMVFSGKGVFWLDVCGIHDAAVVQKIGELFSIHPLVQEDIVSATQRPKYEEFEGFSFFVMKQLTWGKKTGVESQQVSFVLGKDWLLSFRETPQYPLFDGVLKRLRNSVGRIRKEGADYLFYALVDNITDHFFELMNELEEKVQSLEGQIIGKPSKKSLQGLYDLKQTALIVRKWLFPLRNTVHSLERTESPLIRATTRVFLRDLGDHVFLLNDGLEGIREWIATLFELYLSSVSNRMNEVMKTLTLVSTLFIPLTFVAGIYGMNFAFMPELGWRWGYPVVLGVMGGISALMFVFFKKKKWF